MMVFRYIGFYAIGNIFAEHKVLKKAESIKIYWKIILGIVLVAINFVISLFFERKGLIWYANGLIGIIGTVFCALLIDHISRPKVLKKAFVYIGQSSLIILCLHGPVYRIIIKGFSMVLRMGTEDVRTRFVFVLPVIIITLMICLLAYWLIIKFAPCIIGKKKVVKNPKVADKK